MYICQCLSQQLYAVSVSSVASLRWVTPGAATEGVTPLFFPEKPGDLFCSSLSLSLFTAFTRVSPPRGCHPTPFLPVRPRSCTILCKFAHNFFFIRVSPPWRVSPGAVAPPLVTPLNIFQIICDWRQAGRLPVWLGCWTPLSQSVWLIVCYLHVFVHALSGCIQLLDLFE